MEGFILLGVEAGTALLPFLAAFLLCRRAYGRKGVPVTAGRAAAMAVFAAYVAGVFFVTGAGTLHDALCFGLEWRAGQVSLIPFANEISVVGYLLNILLMVPLGFLLPALWRRLEGLRAALFAGFSFSLLIEVSQLFNNRRTDIDDLLMNTLGAGIGCLLYRIIRRRKRGRAAYPGWECVLYIAAMFLGRFLLFDEMGLAGRLYGF